MGGVQEGTMDPEMGKVCCSPAGEGVTRISLFDLIVLASIKWIYFLFHVLLFWVRWVIPQPDRKENGT